MSLAGLYVPDAGQVLFRVTRFRRDHVGFVFQFYNLVPSLTARENVALVTEVAKDPMPPEEALERVGLSHRMDHFPAEMSGGEQQRVAIARALATRSKLLLLDEPLAAVDAQTRADMQDLLLRLAKQFNKTCILVTHDVEEAVYMADRIVVLSKRPTTVIEEIDVPLAKPRDHLTTREDPEFLRIRHEVIARIRSFKP
ncbi:MAG: ABC transporter ATP-binding protein [Paracoccaceae bacterium]